MPERPLRRVWNFESIVTDKWTFDKLQQGIVCQVSYKAVAWWDFKFNLRISLLLKRRGCTVTPLSVPVCPVHLS